MEGGLRGARWPAEETTDLASERPSKQSVLARKSSPSLVSNLVSLTLTDLHARASTVEHHTYSGQSKQLAPPCLRSKKSLSRLVNYEYCTTYEYLCLVLFCFAKYLCLFIC
jgi:hypothetical protein